MPTLSEFESKQLLSNCRGIVFARERLVATAQEAVDAANELGYPVVAKLCGDTIAHKTERGLVRLGITSASDIEKAAGELLAAATPEDGDVKVLVAEMVRGRRELIAGVVHDDTFGHCVMLGVGGILAEAVEDVVFRTAPLSEADANEMIDGLHSQKLLGAFRGEPPVDREALAAVLRGLSEFACATDGLMSVDCNPLIIVDGKPIIVDALVEFVDTAAGLVESAATGHETAAQPKALGVGFESFDSLFSPKGVVVVGASSHPGKFGFTALHNVRAQGFDGPIFPVNRDGETILGEPTYRSVEEIPGGVADMAIICTPAVSNPGILRALAAKGVRAVFVTSAGYREADDAGAQAERELVELASDLGILLAGPNGQGLISTPAKLCAQIVGPYPPDGTISIASQSGNLCSAFMNLASASGIGIARAISVGNAAAVSPADVVTYYGHDSETHAVLMYLENVSDGNRFIDQVGAVAKTKPVVALKGGATDAGQRAAASHTGALASVDRVLDGVLRQIGVARAQTVTEAYDVAATFATQPLPSGPRVAVLTSVGGWGVLTADAIARSSLELAELSPSLRESIDAKLPPRWSKSNPIDMAGGETRDTIPELLDILAGDPGIDAIIFLGSGVQSNTAKLLRGGPFYPEHGLERIVDFHERQDARFAASAAETSRRTGKPILVVTELGAADPGNPGPDAVKKSGRLCYPSAERAIAALDHLWAHVRWRRARSIHGSSNPIRESSKTTLERPTV